MRVKDTVIMLEALRLYQNDWKKTKHNSFMPDMYVFKNTLDVKETWPYVVRVQELLKLKIRALKLQKIKNKIDGKV